MKKTAIALALTLGGAGAVQAESWTIGEFCMFDGTGAVVNGGWATTCDEAVTANLDPGLLPTNEIASTQAFFGLFWDAHTITIYDEPGTYTKDTGNGIYTFTVDPGQIGGHLLFDWGASADIDVVNVWDVGANADGPVYTSTDWDGDGILGGAMIDGAFIGFSANFNLGGAPTLQCKDVFVLTNPDTPIDINIDKEILSTCINIDGTVMLDRYTQPSGGVVTDDGTNLTYTPTEGFGGIDSFTYTAKDDALITATAGIEVQVGGDLTGNFSMMDSTGAVFGGTNDVIFDWDGTSLNTDESDTDFSIMGIKSDKPQPFNGFPWIAHHIRVFGEGTYEFDTGCTVADIEAMGCPADSVGGDTMTMTVGPDQFGAHILFDWNVTENIDVVNVWDQNKQWDRLGHTGEINKLWLGTAGLPPAEDANWELVSTDVDGDGINGSPMLDGPFPNFSANFNNKPDKAGIPPEPFVHTQQDTQLGDGILASMNIVALFASLMMLLGLRQIGRKNNRK